MLNFETYSNLKLLLALKDGGLLIGAFAMPFSMFV